MNKMYNCAYCQEKFESETIEFVCEKCQKREIVEVVEDRREIATRSLNNLLQQAKELGEEEKMLSEWTEEDALHAKILRDISKRIKRPKLVRQETGMYINTGEFKEFRELTGGQTFE